MPPNKRNSRPAPLARIGKVEPQQPAGTEAGWVPFFKGLNILGPIAEAYGKTLAYRVESKRLDIELERIRTEGDIIEGRIERASQLEMEKLQQRRVTIVQHYETLRQELHQKHIERMTVLRMAQEAGAKALDMALPIEDRQFAKEFHAQCMADVHRFGESANASLGTLVQALPPLSAVGLLPSGED